MSTNPVPLYPGNHVTVNDTEAVFDGFVTRDREVVAILAESDSPDHAAHLCLQIGARAIQASNATVDTDIVERSFDAMAAKFETGLVSAITQVEAATTGLVGDDGQITSTLGDWKAEVAGLLGETFNADSKSSVIGKIDKLLADVHAEHVRKLRNVIDPDHDDSPLGKWKRDILGAVKEHAQDVAKTVQDLGEKLAVQQKAAEVFNLTSLKGVKYEDLVHAGVSGLASAYGDEAVQTGRTRGDAGTDKGDEIITLCSDDTGSVCGRIVLEMKDQRLTYPKVMSELDAAAANRNARVAILVFAKQEQAPVAVPFTYTGSRAILVYDKDEPDPNLLRLAYLWARWTVRREVAADDSSAVDRDCVRASIDRIVTAVNHVTTIKGAHTSAKKKIDEATSHVTALQQEIDSALADLREELDK